MKRSMILLATAIASPVLMGSMPSAAAPASSMEGFGKCAAKQYEGAELLATQPGSPEEAEVIAEFARSCGAPTANPHLLRGAIAEQMFKDDFASIGAQPRRDSIEIFTVDPTEFGTLDDTSKMRMDQLAFATCVAASDPQKTVEMLNASAGTAQEASVRGQLQPRFAGCLDEGDRLELANAELRAVLAEGAYRLALTQSLNQEIVVTGTRDASKSVTCKMLAVNGSRFRQKVCMSGAQWATRERDNKLAAEEAMRRGVEHNEARTACITSARFSESGEPCHME